MIFTEKNGTMPDGTLHTANHSDAQFTYVHVSMRFRVEKMQIKLDYFYEVSVMMKVPPEPTPS